MILMYMMIYSVGAMGVGRHTTIEALIMGVNEARSVCETKGSGAGGGVGATGCGGGCGYTTLSSLSLCAEYLSQVKVITVE